MCVEWGQGWGAGVRGREGGGWRSRTGTQWVVKGEGWGWGMRGAAGKGTRTSPRGGGQGLLFARGGRAAGAGCVRGGAVAAAAAHTTHTHAGTAARPRRGPWVFHGRMRSTIWASRPPRTWLPCMRPPREWPSSRRAGLVQQPCMHVCACVRALPRVPAPRWWSAVLAPPSAPDLFLRSPEAAAARLAAARAFACSANAARQGRRGRAGAGRGGTEKAASLSAPPQAATAVDPCVPLRGATSSTSRRWYASARGAGPGRLLMR